MDDFITALCFSVIDIIDDQIEKKFDQVNEILFFYQKRDVLQMKLRIYFFRYLNRNFDLYPHVLKGLGIIKGKEEWDNELK